MRLTTTSAVKYPNVSSPLNSRVIDSIVKLTSYNSSHSIPFKERKTLPLLNFSRVSHVLD